MLAASASTRLSASPGSQTPASQIPSTQTPKAETPSAPTPSVSVSAAPPYVVEEMTTQHQVQENARTASIVTTPASVGDPDRLTIDITGTITPDLLTARVVRRIIGDYEYGLRLLIQGAPQSAYAEIGKEQAKEDNFGDSTKVTNSLLKDEGVGKGMVLSYDASRPYSLTYDKPHQIWLTAPPLRPSLILPDTTTEVEIGLMDVTLTVKYDVPASVRARPPVPISLDREFASYSSSYRVDGQTLFQERRLCTRVKKVSAEQMDAYRAFLRAVDADFRQHFAVEAIPRTDATPQTADELTRTGYAALQKRDAKKAIELLKRATTLDPKHKFAWNNLGRAYNAQREFASAVEAFERAIALNPYRGIRLYQSWKLVVVAEA